MVGWHHQLNGHEFEQALGHSEGRGSPACCGPWGRKALDTAERLKDKAEEEGGQGREVLSAVRMCRAGRPRCALLKVFALEAPPLPHELIFYGHIQMTTSLVA